MSEMYPGKDFPVCLKLIQTFWIPSAVLYRGILIWYRSSYAWWKFYICEIIFIEFVFSQRNISIFWSNKGFCLFIIPCSFWYYSIFFRTKKIRGSNFQVFIFLFLLGKFIVFSNVNFVYEIKYIPIYVYFV